jgi:hypothetical protein
LDYASGYILLPVTRLIRWCFPYNDTIVPSTAKTLRNEAKTPRKDKGVEDFDETPPKTKQELDSELNKQLNSLRPRMKDLVKNAEDVSFLVPSWEPSSQIPRDIAEHLSQMQIPGVPSERPNLLLHDLGEEKDDLDRKRFKRIPEVFCMDQNVFV